MARSFGFQLLAGYFVSTVFQEYLLCLSQLLKGFLVNISVKINVFLVTSLDKDFRDSCPLQSTVLGDDKRRNGYTGLVSQFGKFSASMGTDSVRVFCNHKGRHFHKPFKLSVTFYQFL